MNAAVFLAFTAFILYNDYSWWWIVLAFIIL